MNVRCLRNHKTRQQDKRRIFILLLTVFKDYISVNRMRKIIIRSREESILVIRSRNHLKEEIVMFDSEMACHRSLSISF